MINPFVSNNDSNYLFRKNYQFIAKPQIVAPPSSYSTSKLNILQSKNPFKPSTTPNITSPIPARSLSSSRVGINSPTAKALLGKNKLLDEADGWKRQIENQQRQKLHTYGAEGLRYNAYSTYTPKHYDYKPPQPNRFTPRPQQQRYKQQRRKDNDFSDYYQPAKPVENHKAIIPSLRQNGYQLSVRKEQLQLDSRKEREHFRDQIMDQQQVKPYKKGQSKYGLDVDPIMQQSKKSKLADMFGSVMSNGFRQSINHYSYASYVPDEFVQSKHSRFQTFQKLNHLQESAVRNFEVNGPPTLSIFGTTYHKVDI